MLSALYSSAAITIKLNSFFPSKDLELAQYLSLSLELSTKYQPLDETLVCNSRVPTCSSPRLFLCVRFFEHITSFDFFTSFLDSIQVGDSIYIEKLDFISLLTKSDPSFVWSERVSYPSSESIVDLFNSLGFDLTFRKSFRNKEPFDSLILKRRIFVDSACRDIRYSPNFNLPKLERMIRRSITPLALKYEEFSFYGVGHKSLSWLQLMLSHVNITSIHLMDGNPIKLHSYWDRFKILPFDNLVPHSGLHVFSLIPHMQII